MSNVRVRIAPSPSGFLHIGTAKTALFNWLFARSQGGTFILRLEDTDADRTSEEFVQGVCEGFKWLGIDWDEGPEFGDEPQKGDHGPYRQSLRKDLYLDEARRLVDEGKAYKCFCTKEELDVMREKARAEKRAAYYTGKWRNASPEEVATMGDAPYATRFRVPEGSTAIEDVLQGVVRVDHAEIDDFIIVKPNGAPIFHLAVVVDDGLMQITHVIRGDDHLTNTARHVLLFEALGYDLPTFVHLPMVLDDRGKKYSKRERGANVLDWREDGYLPETLINYVALLGWSPPEDGRELFTRDELVEAFALDRLGASAAKFDLKKLQWLNGQHIRRLDPAELRDRLVPILEAAGFDTSARSEDWLTQMTVICQEKLPTLNHVVQQTDFFFVEPETYEEKGVKKQWGKEGALEKMHAIRAMLADLDPLTHDTMKAAYEATAAEAEAGMGQYIHPTRLALTGKTVGPGLFELAELLGKDTCLRRIDRGIEYIKSMGEGPS